MCYHTWHASHAEAYILQAHAIVTPLPGELSYSVRRARPPILHSGCARCESSRTACTTPSGSGSWPSNTDAPMSIAATLISSDSGMS